MRKTLFDELLKSVREGGSILRAKREAARTFSFEKPDVRRRAQLAKECAKLQRPAEQAAAEEFSADEARWPKY